MTEIENLRAELAQVKVDAAAQVDALEAKLVNATGKLMEKLKESRKRGADAAATLGYNRIATDSAGAQVVALRKEGQAKDVAIQVLVRTVAQLHDRVDELVAQLGPCQVCEAVEVGQVAGD